MWWDRVQPTSQLVAVRGTRENSQPSREGLSEASRMYLSVRIIVSPPKSHQRLCMSESRYGCVRRQGMFAWALRTCDLRARDCVFAARWP